MRRLTGLSIAVLFLAALPTHAQQIMPVMMPRTNLG